MDETIDYEALVRQFQLENEQLRRRLKFFVDIWDFFYKISDEAFALYQKARANKYGVLIGLMIIYWAVSLGLMLYDRLPGKMR